MKDFQSNNSILPDRRKTLGEILVEAGLISFSQFKLALEEQKQSKLSAGEILVAHGLIQAQTIDFFGERWLEVLQEKPKRTTAYYFQEAGLIDGEQLKTIISLQKLKHDKIPFSCLTIELGYLKQNTVDFFLAHIYRVYNPNFFSVAKHYEILKRYLQGKRDFSNLDLRYAPLMEIDLKGVRFDGSNLEKADLSQAKLNSSSLVRVNMRMAIFTQAVLSKVNFANSLLARADFLEAHLEEANFQSAILHEVNFQSAYLARANFSGADLTSAKLPLGYPYEVYYDQHTIFDRDFDPKLVGWKNRTKL